MRLHLNSRLTGLFAAGLILLVGPAALSPAVDEFNKAQSLFKAGQYADAFTKFESFVKKNPGHFQVRNALYLMGESRRLTDNCQEAIIYYRRLTARFTHSKDLPNAHFKTAECYAKIGDKARAKVAYGYYLRKFPYHKLALSAAYKLGDLYYSDRSFDKAIEEFSKVSKSLTQRASKDKRAKALKQDVDLKLGIIYARHKKNVPLAYKYLKPLSEDTDFPGRAQSRGVLRDVTSFRLTTQNGLSGDSISAIGFDGDDIWVGTWLSGLSRYQRSKGQFQILKKDGGLASDAVRDVLVDFNNIWISTYDGLTLLNKESGQAATVGGTKLNKIQHSYKDGAYIYFATLGRGVFRYNRDKGDFSQLSPADLGARYVQRITGAGKELYFCTLKKGLAVHNAAENKTTLVGSAQGLSGNAVNDALKVDGKIWIAVHGHGIEVYDPAVGKVTKKIEPSNHTIHPVVTTLRRRGDQIWASTLGGGVRVYHLKTGQWEKYTVIDGLSSNDVRRLEFEDDYVWMGTLDKGITIVYWPAGQTKP